MPLQSERFLGDAVLEACLAGAHRMMFGEQGEAVRKVQQALIDLGYSIPDGATGGFFAQTSAAVVHFKSVHSLVPTDPVIGPGTMAALDADIIAFDEGQAPPPPPPSVLTTLTFWINAFIPDPSMSPHVLPAPGASVGKSMIIIPAPHGIPLPLPRGFLGDSRGFTSDVFASARIHSLVEIAHLDLDAPQLQAVENKCGESHEIDLNTGEIIGSDTAPTDRIRFLNLRGNTSIDPEGGVIIDSDSPRFVQLDYEAAASLPLIGGSPDIDMLGVLQIDRDASSFRFRGAVDGFPAFEAYVSFNLGPAITLFQLSPIGPLEVVGEVKRDIDVTVPIVA